MENYKYMPIPEKKQRNKEIYKRRKGGWTLGELSKHYGISRPYVVQIVQREVARESVKST